MVCFMQSGVMSNDSFTETSSRGWFSRIGGAFKGILVGVVLVIATIVGLFINEGRAVNTRKSLDEGAGNYVTISAEKVNSEQEGKLVHFSADATSEEILSDSDLQVSATALRMKREVETYLWKESKKTETRKKLGGSEETVTTYNYEKGWSGGAIDSSKFKKPEGHENPEPVLGSQEWTAEPIQVGAYVLSPSLAGKIGGFTTHQVDAEVERPDFFAQKRLNRKDGGFYLGTNPSRPEIGDSRVSYEVALPGKVTVISKQKGNSFEAYTAKAGGKINMLAMGEQSAESMFETAQKSNKMMTWLFRGLGFALMFAGFSMLFRPLSVIADVLPIAGNIVGMGTKLVSFLLALPISLAVIGFAWVWYRPLLGVPLLVAALAGFGFLIKKFMDQRKKAV